VESGDGSGGNKALWVDRRVGLKVALEILASEVMEGLTRVIAGSGFWRFGRFWRFCGGGCEWGRVMAVVETKHSGLIEGLA
jgi:hypothetical protein